MDQKIREAERNHDIQAWAAWTLRLGDVHLIEQLASIRQQLEWLKKQEAILAVAIPLCACGEGATHGTTCEAHQNTLAEYQIARQQYLADPSNVELARTMVELANNCGHPNRVRFPAPPTAPWDGGSCYFPDCLNPPDWDYDLEMAFCVGHNSFFSVLGPDYTVSIARNKARARTPYENISTHLLK